MFTVWLALSPLLCENFKKTCQQTSWLVLQHLWPHSQPTTSPKKTTMSTPLTDPASFGTHIQSLRSVNHPIHRIPRAARPSFASGLSKLTKPFLQTHYLIGIVWYVSPFQSSHQAPDHNGSPWPHPPKQELTRILNPLACLALKPLRDKQPHHQPQPTTTQPKTWKDW